MTGQGKNGIDMVLAESLKELTATRPIEKITIKEITDKAGVIRPTFYNHFQDKFELLEWIIRTDLLEPIAPLVKAGMVKEAMVLMFTNMEADKAFYAKAVKLEGAVTFHEIAMRCTQQMIFDVITEMSQGKGKDNKWLTPETLSMYYAQSMCFAAEQWVALGMPISPKEMGDAYEYMLTRSLADIIKDL